ncbi:hypothetical protein EDC94DRAFT_624587 [Helicostylum pulchrum]|nr:hypothetical protein EDC94DRAFT_624587 [Helicostylum pulchrum]
MTLPVHPLQAFETSNLMMANPTTLESTQAPARHHQQRAYSVTAMPSELQKSVQRHQEAEHQEKLRSNQPWWQYYYQLYHYHLPPGRKPTVFGPYLLLQTMGEGEFGKVKFGIEVKTGQEVAIKLIRKDSIDSSSRMTKVEREISVLRILHHPNIVELFDVIETEKYIGIILQCATGGELFDYILAHRYLKERDASRLFAQLISGVHYMHQKHIVHRDLKLENLLLDRHRNVLITDFGFANQFSSPQDDLMSTSCGSPCYAAPELVMNQGVYVGPAVDIWSCGVILFAMLCGYLPYDDDPANPESYNINLLYKYILNTPLIFPDYISDEACDLLSLMLVPDPEKRCSMETIMAHPWLSPHTHLFVHLDSSQIDPMTDETEQDAMVPDHQQRRNTIANLDQFRHPIVSTASTTTEPGIKEEEDDDEPQLNNTQQQDQLMEEHIQPAVEQEEEEEETKGDQIMQEQLVPEQDTPPAVPSKDTVQPQPTNQTDDPMQEEEEDIIAIELPPPTLADETLPPCNTNKDLPVRMTDTTKKDTFKEEPHVSPVPSTSKIRPKSTVSSSTEKVLHFLSGHSTTPKPTQRNTNRTRHMSLAPTTTNTEGSILQAKFLSSVQQQQQKKKTDLPVPNTSASTPHPKRTSRHQSPAATTPPVSRGTRKKTLSLLVNSMTDNKMSFSHRRQSTTTTTPPPQPEGHRAPMMPSVSEHTMHTLSDKEKHRSAGKKLMDWFKKKPLSTIHRSTNQASDMLHGDRVTPEITSTTDLKLRTHHGAVDQEALTSRSPALVFQQVKQTLKSLGLEFKRDGGEFKLKCARHKKPVLASAAAKTIQHPHGNNTPFRMLLRRSSQATTHSSSITSSSSLSNEATIYGDVSVDPGDEVRFSVELCRIKNLPGLYIVDMRRMRGNVWAYKFIYRTLLDTLNLGGKSGYLNTNTTTESSLLAAAAAVADEDHSHHRMSTASSGAGSSSVLLDETTLTVKQEVTPVIKEEPVPTPIIKEEITA